MIDVLCKPNSQHNTLESQTGASQPTSDCLQQWQKQTAGNTIHNKIHNYFCLQNLLSPFFNAISKSVLPDVHNVYLKEVKTDNVLFGLTTTERNH